MTNLTQTKDPKEGQMLEIKQVKAETEDSIATDINNFKAFSKKLLLKISSKVRPYPRKGGDVASKPAGIIRKSSLGKIIRMFLILFFLIILILVAVRLFKTGTNGGGGNGSDSKPTPTPVSYEPYRPSLYADDPEIKKLEEDINVLVGEISSTNVRELDLNPPLLDFNISF